ncbi:uncharacterized protein LOC135142537 [Zophobas morio]|uniref:uncharacterized protein LOC135142537 n=1 Tax=Zophobas morio TaxID=2755281 RepID=UPI0030830A33
MKHLLTTLCFCLVPTSFGAKLPTSFKKCNLKQISSRLCLPKAIESAIKQMDHPIKELGLIRLEPVVIPSLIIDAGSQYVTSKQIFENLKLSGFNETSCSKAEFSYKEKTLSLECVVPNFRMDFNYEVHGQVMLASVYGNGTGWIIFHAGSQYVHTKQIFKNLKLSGFNETSCSKAEFNYNEKILDLECVVPNFRMDFNYDIHGEVLKVPVYGNGTGWIIFRDNQFRLTFELGEYEKNGEKYFNIVHQQLKMQAKDIDFDVQNLFDGDEESASRVKKLIKDNILELFDDIKPGYEEAFGKIFAYIFEQILEKVPIYDIFS